MHKLCSPLRAEAAAVLCAIQLALTENWGQIIIEGDAKSCFDPLTIAEIQSDWSIATTVNNILELRNFFLNCNFYWVRRCFNTAAHEAAKYAVKLRSFCPNKCRLPVEIAGACMADC